MPLLDHFHAPLYPERKWESFHAHWAGSISTALNTTLLPPGYFSEIQVHVGSRVEVDVGTFDRGSPRAVAVTLDSGKSSNGGAATITAPAEVWAPPAPEMVMPAIFPDSVEVLVYNTENDYNLVAAVELISPGNKDREDARTSFAAKCATYLREGVGLVTIDIVTSRRGNLHNDLIRLLGTGDEFLLSGDDLYAVAYRPVRQSQSAADPAIGQIHVWPAALSVGQGLPVLPLALDRGVCLPLDLDGTYAEARRRSRLS